MKSLRSLAAASLAILLAFPAVAGAHAQLESSDPASRATLDHAPDAVRLRFNEKIEIAYSKIAIEKSGGESVAAGPTHLAVDDPQVLVLDLPPLASGSYTVRFEVLSVDGHRVKQSFAFTVK